MEINEDFFYLTPAEFRKKYPGGVYVLDPLSDDEFIDPSSEEYSHIEELTSEMKKDFELSRDIQFIYEGNLKEFRLKLAEMESSGDKQLLSSMYYHNYKQRVQELEKLKVELESDGWEFDY